MWCRRVGLTFCDLVALSVRLGFDYVALYESLHDLLRAAGKTGGNSHNVSNIELKTGKKTNKQHMVSYLVSGWTVRSSVRIQAFVHAKLQGGD